MSDLWFTVDVGLRFSRDFGKSCWLVTRTWFDNLGVQWIRVTLVDGKFGALQEGDWLEMPAAWVKNDVA